MKRWHKVTMKELEQIWNDLQDRGEWFNGCTSAELVRIYGPTNIKHKIGYGWYKLTTKEAA